MSSNRRWSLTLTLSMCAGCTAPSVTGTIEGEPVCPDFVVGATGTKMKGSLRQPVQVSLLDGSTARWERVLLGRRTDADPHSKFVVEDSDETYTARWAQCPNAFAPKRASLGKSRAADHVPHYDCGEAKVYQEEKLVVRAGDASSRVLHWVTPPAPSCWSNLAPEAAASGSASAAAAAEPSSAPSASATASASASAAPSASTASSARPAARPPPRTTGAASAATAR